MPIRSRLPRQADAGKAAGLVGVRPAGARRRRRVAARARSRRLGHPERASAMELNIPGIRGVGDSQIFFVDRHGDYSIYDVDFEPVPASRSSRRHWPACTTSAWCRRSASTARRLGRLLPRAARLLGPAGRQVLRRDAQGHAARSPSHNFYLQLVEPPLCRKCCSGKSAWCASVSVRPTCARGARTAARGHRLRRPRPGSAERKAARDEIYLGGVTFELVISHSAAPEERRSRRVDLDRYGMDTITLAGSLQPKLAAMKAAGFTQVMLSARDIVADPAARPAAIAAVRDSGLRVTGFQVLRDFEGLSGRLHAYKVDVAKAMLVMCHALGSRVLLVCSSTSTHATADRDHLVRDLQKLAMLAAPLGIRVAFEALSWGRHVNEYAAGLGDHPAGRPQQPRHRHRLVPPPGHAVGLRVPRGDRCGKDLPRAAGRLHVAGTALARGAHQHGAALSRVSRRRRAQR